MTDTTTLELVAQLSRELLRIMRRFDVLEAENIDLRKQLEELTNSGKNGEIKDPPSGFTGIFAGIGAKLTQDHTTQDQIEWELPIPNPSVSQRHSPGDLVHTWKDAGRPASWEPEARVHVAWGVLGHICSVHDAHGLCYKVKHLDGSFAFYDHDELLRRRPSV